MEETSKTEEMTYFPFILIETNLYRSLVLTDREMETKYCVLKNVLRKVGPETATIGRLLPMCSSLPKCLILKAI